MDRVPDDPDSHPNFFGTSASAPHAAGLAALMLQVDPTLTPDEIYQVMRDTAIDQGEMGHDFEWGYGILDAVGAIYKVWKPDPPTLLTDTGVSATDGITNDRTPTFTGAVPPDSYVALYANGRKVGQQQLSGGATDYTITSSQLSGTTYSFAIRIGENQQTLAAGNMSRSSDAVQVKFDTVAPRITQVSVATTMGGINPSFPVPAQTNSGVQLVRVPVFQPNRIEITFDQDLADLVFAPGSLPALTGSDMQLFSRTTSQSIPLNGAVTYDSATQTATWSITTPIAGLHQIELSLFDTVEDVAGNKLDAEGWVSPDSVFDTSGNSAYPSGDGTAGGSLTDFRFTLMPGDVVGASDNIINLTDFALWQQNQGGGPNGDADFDGDVDGADFDLILNNFNIDFRNWPGGAAAASAGATAARLDNETRPTGIEAVKIALLDYYARRTNDPNPSREFDSLLGWHMFGDKAWWNDLLGNNWATKL